MIRSFFVIIILIASATIISCKHDPESVTGGNELTPIDTTTPPPPVVKCSQDTIYFENEILPLFVSNCAKSGCHDPATAHEGVILNNYNNIIQTGEVRPFNPGGSKVFEKITETNSEDRMPPPPALPLTSAQIESIRKWINQGALNNKCDSVNCDTTNVTYAGSLKPIVDLTCKGCHSGAAPAGNIDLTTAAGLQSVAQTGQLMGAITHQSQFPMPKGGSKLPDCQITMFSKWIQLNYPLK